MLLSALVATSAIAGSYIPIAPETVDLGEARGVWIEHPSKPGVRVKADVEMSATVTMRVVDAQTIGETSVRGFDISTLTRSNYPATPIRSQSQVVLDGCYGNKIGWNFIEEVEIIRGPASTLWGKALHDGVINVVTKTHKELLEDEPINVNAGVRENGWTRWTVGYQYKNLYADAQIFQTTRIEGQEPKRELIGSTTLLAGTVLLPTEPRSAFEEDGPDVSKYIGELGGIRFTPTYSEKLGTNGIWLPRAQLTAGYTFNYGEPGVVTSQDYLKHCARNYGQERVQNWVVRSQIDLGVLDRMMNGAAAQGTDMNRLNFPGNVDDLGTPECGSSVSFPPGTMWLPDRGGYQGMSNITGFNYNFPAFVSMAPEGIPQAEMRTHCVSMGLKEPAAGVKYFPFASPDTVLTQLAKLAESSRIRGPWDQARTWIYTDKASHAEINKRLMPGITEGQYVNGLWDVARFGGLTKEDMRSGEIFDPKLLLASTAREDSFGWFASHMAQNFGKESRQWLERNASQVAALFGPESQEIERKHPARLLRIMLGSRNADARLGALGCLARLGDAGAAVKDQIGDLRMSLYSNDPKEVEMALAASGIYQTQRATEALQYLAERGANEAIKSKAAGLLKA